MLASYDADELRRIHETLLPTSGLDLDLIQLVSDNDGAEVKIRQLGQLQPYNYDWMFTKFGLKAVSAYAGFLGVLPQALFDETGELKRQNYLEDARLLGLRFLIYPLDSTLPPLSYAQDFEALLEHFLFIAGLDGVLTDKAEAANAYLEQRAQSNDAAAKQIIPIDKLIERVEKNSPVEELPQLQDHPM